jgi:hypothetical protein
MDSTEWAQFSEYKSRAESAEAKLQAAEGALRDVQHLSIEGRRMLPRGSVDSCECISRAVEVYFSGHATVKFTEDQNLPPVGSYCMISGANNDSVDEPGGRSYSHALVLGYSPDHQFICCQNDGCWPFVQRVSNCYFKPVTLAGNAPAPSDHISQPGKMVSDRERRLESALSHIGEYWNRSETDGAMADALWHIIETVDAALADTTEVAS